MNPGKTLRSFRKLHGLTQHDLAAYLFVSDATISVWERNVCRISVEDFDKLLDYMGYKLTIIKKKEKKYEQ